MCGYTFKLTEKAVNLLPTGGSILHTTNLSTEETLSKVFGLTKLREKQSESIALTLAGKHTLNLLPTGYGKSLCYQLPSQLLPGVTLVISPLIALMEDQISGLRKRGITNATVLNSSVHPEELQERIDLVRSGYYKLVYVAPERLDSPRFRALLQSIKVSLLVTDEAHCISQWGHDFRPQYRHMKSLIALLPDSTVMALTATATPKVQKDIITNLGLNMEVVKGDFDRPNLILEVEKCDNPADKDRHLFARLKHDPAGHGGSAIVYVSSRKEAEALSKRLNGEGIKAAFYHAGLPAPMRKATQKRFEDDLVKVIVCTVAFGMGVDKANIRKVVHYNLPPSLENYYQEAGRAGRDGQPATCTLLYQPKDIYTQRWLTKMNYPTEKQIFEVYEFLRLSQGSPVRPSAILEAVPDIKETPLHSTLDLFNQLGLLTLSPGGITLKTIPSYLDTSILTRRKEQDEDRLERMISYALTPLCRRRTILGYFGQALVNDCSGCDVCHPHLRMTFSPTPSRAHRAVNPERETIKKARQALAARQFDQDGFISAADAANIKSQAGKGDNLSQAIVSLTTELKGQVGRTTVASILAGSKAKKLADKGFDKLSLYGACAHRNQDTILEAIDALIEEGHLRVIPGMYPKLTIA